MDSFVENVVISSVSTPIACVFSSSLPIAKLVIDILLITSVATRNTDTNLETTFCFMIFPP